MGEREKGLGNFLDRLAKWLLRFRVFAIPARMFSNSRIAWSMISRVDRVRVRRQKDRLLSFELPNHISIIMDGNRRFAWNRMLGAEIGHRHGKEKLKQVMDWVLDLGIPYLTVYALSTENISGREDDELGTLYDLYVTGLDEIAEDPRIHEKKVRVRVAGRVEMLPQRVQDAIDRAEERTRDYSDFTFTVCLAYGGREEIVDAVKGVAEDHSAGRLSLDEIDTEEISKRLYDAHIPDPDLVIRTSGEERVSNFLLWQIAYSELYFTDVHWPSFSKADLYEALESYQLRRRRYGE
tara:strand:+ start:9482 stop:10363 length:882 start_codon:yes stop_codon:yes gene_type:complete